MRIYLAGFINGNKIEECVSWRRNIREFYNNYKGAKYPIEWLDPCNGYELANIDAQGLTSNLPANMIVDKDFLSVNNSDLVIANMNTFGEERPPIGTICEITWAKFLRKPVIMISDNPLYINHPFLKDFTSVIVPTVEELLDKKYINSFFKSINSAEY